MIQKHFSLSSLGHRSCSGATPPSLSHLPGQIQSRSGRPPGHSLLQCVCCRTVLQSMAPPTTTNILCRFQRLLFGDVSLSSFGVSVDRLKNNQQFEFRSYIQNLVVPYRE